MLNPSPAVAATYTAAATSRGVLPRAELPAVLRPGVRAGGRHRLAGEWTSPNDTVAVLRACRLCGGIRRAVMRLREVPGSLCLDCRTDRAGVPWDASYDRFRDSGG